MRAILVSAKRYLHLTALFAFLAPACMLLAVVNAQEGVMARSTIKGNPTAVCGRRAYVTNSYSNTLSVIDLSENRLVENLPTGNAPVNPTFNRDWTKLYFSNVMDGTLSIVDAKIGKIVKTIPAGAPHPSGLQFFFAGRQASRHFLCRR